MNTATSKEPLITIGVIGSLVTSAIVLLQSFGVPLTDAQSSAINQFVAVAAPIVIALIGRGFVFSPNTTKNVAENAAQTGVVPPSVK
jgi:hypothetical protein